MLFLLLYCLHFRLPFIFDWKLNSHMHGVFSKTKKIYFHTLYYTFHNTLPRIHYFHFQHVEIVDVFFKLIDNLLFYSDLK